MPCLLAFQVPLSAGAYTHVLVSVTDNQPTLYINGKFARRGVKANKELFYFPDLLGAGAYGGYKGFLDEFVVFDRGFTASEALDLFSREDVVSTSTCFDQLERSGASSLACPAGQEITSIDFASWGTATGACGQFEVDTDCHSPLAEIWLGHNCIGKQTCQVEASNDHLGDPCRGVTKSLKAQFTCRPRNETVRLTSPFHLQRTHTRSRMCARAYRTCNRTRKPFFACALQERSHCS